MRLFLLVTLWWLVVVAALAVTAVVLPQVLAAVVLEVTGLVRHP